MDSGTFEVKPSVTVDAWHDIDQQEEITAAHANKRERQAVAKVLTQILVPFATNPGYDSSVVDTLDARIRESVMQHGTDEDRRAYGL